MTAVRPTIAADINRLHGLATARATEAIGYAKQAGILLLEVKAALKHGEWLPWLAANVTVSARQVQRYVAVAQGKAVTVRELAGSLVVGADQPSNTTAVSHIEADAPRNMPGDPDVAPTFMPESGLCYACPKPVGEGPTYLVEPSSKWPNFFFVTRMNDDDSDSYDCTRRPVHRDFVEENLKYYGMADPAGAEWKVKDSPGVLAAMDTFAEVFV